ncbi:MAG: hypothetical protein B7Z64_08915, partial [Acidiphilium sp. 21-68-69]
MTRLGTKSLKRSLLAASFGILGAGALVLSAQAAGSGSESLVQMQKNANDWVMPTGTYNNWRYSTLDQI